MPEARLKALANLAYYSSHFHPRVVAQKYRKVLAEVAEKAA
jgi:hypothetical protein